MQESDSHEIVLEGAEADAINRALQQHEPETADVEEGTVEELESLFDRDLEDTEEGEFEFTRGEARVVLSAVEEREPTASGQLAQRLESLRHRIASAFKFEERLPDGAKPLEDERYPGSS